MTTDLDVLLLNLKQAARLVRRLPTEQKNQLLSNLALGLKKEETQILEANRKDLEALAPATTSAFRDRLTLNPDRLAQMAESLRQVAALPDPVGEIVEQKTLANGLKLERVRAPLGVLFMIFESRPNVILEAFSLAFKAGNVILLRGGSESRFTAQAVYALMERTMASLSYLPFVGLQDYDRELVAKLLTRKESIDVVIPRGGEKLIEFVQQNARMPIIKNDRGLCHAFVDESADLDMALRIVENGKVQRPGVCNSLETVLVHRALAQAFLTRLYERTRNVNLAFRVDAESKRILGSAPSIRDAQTEDWDTEYLDLILNSRVVANLDEALMHIQQHGSKHSEVIITSNPTHAKTFLTEVDAAAVYWNASTRFTDGFEFGLGGELGISTQKLHVRGPVGLRELTTPRWLAVGSGQIR